MYDCLARRKRSEKKRTKLGRQVQACWSGFSVRLVGFTALLGKLVVVVVAGLDMFVVSCVRVACPLPAVVVDGGQEAGEQVPLISAVR